MHVSPCGQLAAGAGAGAGDAQELVPNSFVQGQPALPVIEQWYEKQRLIHSRLVSHAYVGCKAQGR